MEQGVGFGRTISRNHLEMRLDAEPRRDVMQNVEQGRIDRLHGSVAMIA